MFLAEQKTRIGSNSCRAEGSWGPLVLCLHAAPICPLAFSLLSCLSLGPHPSCPGCILSLTFLPTSLASWILLPPNRCMFGVAVASNRQQTLHQPSIGLPQANPVPCSPPSDRFLWAFSQLRGVILGDTCLWHFMSICIILGSQTHAD